jgi:hypothetical protein
LCAEHVRQLRGARPVLKAIKSLKKEKKMNTFLVIAIPLVLVIIGMILNSIGLSFDQPESSPEQDPAKNWQPKGKLTAPSSTSRESDL